MELNKFISESLINIIKGVSEAQKYGNENDCIINPDLEQWDENKMMSIGYYKKDGMRPVYKVDFEIAVIVSEEKQKGGGGSINVYSLKAGADIKKSENKENVSKINFSLNIALPSAKSKPLKQK